jgi:GTP cyclohydrolase IA
MSIIDKVMSNKKKVQGIEITQPGFANGISTQLHQRQQADGPHASLSEDDLVDIIDEAAIRFGQFLTALGVDWKNDPNSSDTPRRVAKAYVYDLWRGRYTSPPEVTAFPSDGYTGIIFEGGIPLTSMCSHHHGLIQGRVHIAYIPSLEGKVIGLSKLNRIVEHFGRRGAIQEQLTVAIHNAVDKICEQNIGVAVMVEATHACVSCRGVKHQGASMKTAKLSGAFLDEDSARAEFYEFTRGYTPPNRE